MKKFTYPLFAALVGFSSFANAATVFFSDSTDITESGQTYSKLLESSALPSLEDVQLSITARGDYNKYDVGGSSNEFLTFTIDDSSLYSFELNIDSADSFTQINGDTNYYELNYTHTFSSSEWNALAGDERIDIIWSNSSAVGDIDFESRGTQSGDLVSYRFSTVSAIPEPSTYALMIAGLGLVGFMVSRRKKA
ncbi:MAG TPA: PEP-CTERM sorting domain-containing protein [Thiomicrospira sp.]|nr:PEP-CTERM sorting domain-containing protein [Thiomicrospira sp.]